MVAPVRFLFTSVGRRVELIRHFLAWQESNPGVFELLGTDVDAHAPAAQLLGSRLRGVPATADPSYVEIISSLCRAEGVDAIFPLIDPDIVALARHRDIPIASVGPGSVDLVSDKWLTAQWLLAHGVPAPRTWLPSSTMAEELPAFIKPRRGSGGVDAYAVRSRCELDFFAQRIDEPVLQELLPGPEVTVDVVIGRDGAILAIAQRLRLAVRGGEVSRAVLIDDPSVTRTVERVVESLAPTGPITVQGMYGGDRTFRVTEINGRMGGGLPLAIAGGVPVAGLLARSWAGDHVNRVESLDIGLHMVRFDESFFYRK